MTMGKNSGDEVERGCLDVYNKWMQLLYLQKESEKTVFITISGEYCMVCGSLYLHKKKK
jgi:hypothetical protein